jgi:hypothetical protein
VPNPEKSLLKAAAHDETAAKLSEALVNAEKNALGLAASRDTTERLFARIAGYRARIDEAFKDGKFPVEASEPVYAVFRDIVAIVQDSHRALVGAAAEQGPFAAGLRKALALTREQANIERALAERAVELDREEQEQARRDDPPAETPSPVAVTAPHGSPATQGATNPQDEAPASARAQPDDGAPASREQLQKKQTRRSRRAKDTG